MAEHKFEIGDMVAFKGAAKDPMRARGEFEVIRQLPLDGEPQYRLKGRNEPYERMARESQLDPAVR